MISGTLILSKKYNNITEYLKKRVLRILFPFLFWSIIYILKELFCKFNNGEELNLIQIILFFFVKIKNGASIHLWYIYMIVGLYLFFPIIGKWLHNSNKYEIRYFLIIWILTILVQIPFFDKITPKIELGYFSGYIGFPVLGYYLNKISLKINNKVTIGLTITGVLITIFGTYFMTNQIGFLYEGFYDYLSTNVMITSIGIFLLFKNSINFNSSTINFLSTYSYGVYLVHFLVLWLLEEIGFTCSFVNPIIGIPTVTSLCFIISTSIIWAVNKLPFRKYISG